MHYLKLIIIFFLYFSSAYADQTDKRLDDLFNFLAKSDNVIEINRATSLIWKIWLETNDPVIEKDFAKGLNLMQNGEYKKSIEKFTKVIENNPKFAEGWNKRATVYYLIGDFDSSIMDIKETLKLEPRHFGALDGLSVIFIHLQQYKNAIEVYDEILKFFPNNLNILEKRKRLETLISKKI